MVENWQETFISASELLAMSQTGWHRYKLRDGMDIHSC